MRVLTCLGSRRGATRCDRTSSDLLFHEMEWNGLDHLRVEECGLAYVTTRQLAETCLGINGTLAVSASGSF